VIRIISFVKFLLHAFVLLPAEALRGAAGELAMTAGLCSFGKTAGEAPAPQNRSRANRPSRALIFFGVLFPALAFGGHACAGVFRGPEGPRFHRVILRASCAFM
jgi:hypothetical protein